MPRTPGVVGAGPVGGAGRRRPVARRQALRRRGEAVARRVPHVRPALALGVGDEGPAPGGAVARRPGLVVRVRHQGARVGVTVPRRVRLGRDPAAVVDDTLVLLAPTPLGRVVDGRDRGLLGPPPPVLLRPSHGADAGAVVTTVEVAEAVAPEVQTGVRTVG